MKGESLFMLLFGCIVLGYAFLFLSKKEGFQAGAGANSPTVGQLYPTPMPVNKPDTPPTGNGRVLMEYTTLPPVAKGQIQSLDDYEYNYVYQNESDRALSQGLKNKLMSQRPMEWAGLPPSSQQFQAGLRESFQNATPTVPDNAQPYQAISGQDMVPPDTVTTEMEERKVLQTYKAPSALDLASYNPDEDPELMIKKLYDVKGLVPIIAHKEGTNVYEVIGVRKKDEKILYEDEEAPASNAPLKGAGEANIEVPIAAYDTAAARDPFYDTNVGAGKTRIGKWDYQAWTPGLDRMFGPTNDTQNWN
jgi:hypothetical protein